MSSAPRRGARSLMSSVDRSPLSWGRTSSPKWSNQDGPRWEAPFGSWHRWLKVSTPWPTSEATWWPRSGAWLVPIDVVEGPLCDVVTDSPQSHRRASGPEGGLGPDLDHVLASMRTDDPVLAVERPS